MKTTIDLGTVTVELRKRFYTEDGRGFSTRRTGERDAVIRLTIDTKKLYYFGQRAAMAKGGKATMAFGGVIAQVVSASDRLIEQPSEEAGARP